MSTIIHARFPMLLLAGIVSLPTFGQREIVGSWSPRYHEDVGERMEGPALGDYLGIPLNDAGRLRAESWSASLLTLPERQCMPHPADYTTRGPADLRVSTEVNPATQELIAYHMHIRTDSTDRTVWMDGRPHPSAMAAYTWQGFSTGVWEANVLKVVTTHLKPGFLRRNGVPRSSLATLIEHWIRHGSSLTLVQIIDDPAYLAEPMIRTTDWEENPDLAVGPFPCESVEEIDRPAGTVPHYLPGKNPFLTEFSAKHKISTQASGGGAETIYPEYRQNPQVRPTAPNRPSPPANTFEVVPVRGGVFMLTGTGGNVTVQVGPQGVVLVDAGSGEATPKLLNAIRQLSSNPIRYLINTSADRDHTGGNREVASAGRALVGFGGANIAATLEVEGAAILAHLSVLNQMSADSVPSAAWPTSTFSGTQKNIFFNDEAVSLLHQPAAQTAGDSIVFFRRSDVVSVGDILDLRGYPRIDIGKGGSIQGELDALNRLIELAVPGDHEEGGTYIIPGHGRLCDRSDVTEYRDMLTILRDRVADAIKRGLSPEQVKASQLTRDYDPLFAAEPAWTPEMFVDAVYRSLVKR